jgi:glutathione reductase (NADPH)
MSKRAAIHGARVAICEEGRYGGTCVHRGCVPKKLMSYAASFPYEVELMRGYGYAPGPLNFDWPSWVEKKDKELDRLLGFYTRSLDEGHVDRFSERAKLVDAHTVEVGDKRITAESIAFAVGAWPFKPDVPGIELAITSNEAFSLAEFPKDLIVMGSGYIGVELASLFLGLGSQTRLMFRSDLPLPGFDQDVRTDLLEAMRGRGMTVITGCHLQRLERKGDKILVVTDQGEWLCDQFLCAAGRNPNTANLGLEAAGVELGEKGAIKVDDECRTNVPSIYAVGDVIDKVQLTPYAIAQGRWLSDRLFGKKKDDFWPKHIPTAVFSLPPVGTVGLTEAEAREQNPNDIEIYRTRFRPMKYTLPNKTEKVLMKLVVRKSDQRVLGIHMIGSDAAETIQALAITLTCGATKQQFDHTLAVHPTGAEEFVLLREPVYKA